MKTEMRPHPKRKPIRLKNYDYSQSGWYFVTICTQSRNCIFGSIQPASQPIDPTPHPVGARRGAPEPTRGPHVSYQMVTNVYGAIVEMVWKSLPQHHPVEIDEFQVMPNHIHGIIRITGRGTTPGETTPTLGTIVGLFKSACTKQIHRIAQNPKMVVWQRNYYERIIRTQTDLNKTRWYIKHNPQMWPRDRNNPTTHP